TLKRAPRTLLRRASQKRVDDWFYRVRWRPQPLASARQTAAALSGPAEIAGKVGPHWPALVAEYSLARHAAFRAGMDRLSERYAAEALAGLGVSLRPGTVFLTESIADALRSTPPQRRLLARLAEMLVAPGIVRPREGGWEVIAGPGEETAEALWYRV